MTLRPLALACAALALCGTRAVAQAASAPADTSARKSAVSSPAADSSAARGAVAVYDSASLTVLPRPRNVPEFERMLGRTFGRLLSSMGPQGGVTIEITIGADGRLEDARVLKSSGDPHVDAAALRAVHVLRFTPGQVNGQAVRCRMVLPVTYATSNGRH